MIIKPEFFRIDRLFKKFKKLGKIEKGFTSFKNVMNIYSCKISYLILGIFLNLVADVFIMVTYYFVSLSIGLDLNFMTFAFIVPVIFVFTGIPISIGGLGVRENTIIFMLSGFGVSNSTAVLFSFLILFVFVFDGVLGGIIYLCKNIFYKSRTFI